MSEELKQAAIETNRALEAYVAASTSGDDRLPTLRAELNAAYRKQYDEDRRSSRFYVDEERAGDLVAAANQRAEEIAARLVDVRRYALDKGDQQLAAIVAIHKPQPLNALPKETP